MQPNLKSNKGFTVLMAALVASIALVVGAAIFSITNRQIALSSLSKNSQYAFYAADTATECALYWDVRYNYFATTTPSGVSPTCDGKSIALSTPLNGQPYRYTVTTPSVDLTAGANGQTYCAIISVTKNVDARGNVLTIIHTDGYSSNCASITTNPTVLQRSVELSY